MSIRCNIGGRRFDESSLIETFLMTILIISTDTSSASVGLAISQSMILIGGLQYGMKQSVESISLMTAVERVLQYTNLPLEGPIFSDNPPPPTWPDKGQLVFKDVSMSYEKNSPPVLKVSESHSAREKRLPFSSLLL